MTWNPPAPENVEPNPALSKDKPEARVSCIEVAWNNYGGPGYEPLAVFNPDHSALTSSASASKDTLPPEAFHGT